MQAESARCIAHSAAVHSRPQISKATIKETAAESQAETDASGPLSVKADELHHNESQTDQADCADQYLSRSALHGPQPQRPDTNSAALAGAPASHKAFNSSMPASLTGAVSMGEVSCTPAASQPSPRLGIQPELLTHMGTGGLDADNAASLEVMDTEAAPEPFDNLSEPPASLNFEQMQQSIGQVVAAQAASVAKARNGFVQLSIKEVQSTYNRSGDGSAESKGWDSDSLNSSALPLAFSRTDQSQSPEGSASELQHAEEPAPGTGFEQARLPGQESNFPAPQEQMLEALLESSDGPDFGHQSEQVYQYRSQHH